MCQDCRPLRRLRGRAPWSPSTLPTRHHGAFWGCGPTPTTRRICPPASWTASGGLAGRSPSWPSPTAKLGSRRTTRDRWVCGEGSGEPSYGRRWARSASTTSVSSAFATGAWRRAGGGGPRPSRWAPARGRTRRGRHPWAGWHHRSRRPRGHVAAGDRSLAAVGLGRALACGQDRDLARGVARPPRRSGRVDGRGADGRSRRRGRAPGGARRPRLERKRAVLAAHASQSTGVAAAMGEPTYCRWIAQEAFRRASVVGAPWAWWRRGGSERPGRLEQGRCPPLLALCAASRPARFAFAYSTSS